MAKISVRQISLKHSFNMSKTALVLLAEGAEEMEIITPADTLRRAGVKVTIAGLAGNSAVICSRDVKIVPDDSLENAIKNGPYDAVILPGGLKGAENLGNSAVVGSLVTQQESEGRLVAAICAAPTALKKHGVGKGKRVTSYPSVKDKMEGDGYTYCEDRVVVDGQLITSRGPGTALEWSLAIVNNLMGEETMNTLKKAMLLKE
ncbi:hypothetical protein B566_EDAN001986 [Ephemera danica]|nr:hypothetical protein B566_EDAN001986 [Ephemera danica]